MELNGWRLQSKRLAAANSTLSRAVHTRSSWLLVGSHQSGRPMATLIHPHSESSEVWAGTGGTGSGDDRFAMWSIGFEVFFYRLCESSERYERSPFMRIIRLKEVIDYTGLGRSTIYKYISEGSFPKSVSLGDRAVGWVESEVHDWILARIEERDLT